MNTTAIIAITVAICLFSILLIACASVLIYTLIQLQRRAHHLSTTLELIASNVASNLDQHYAKIQAQVALINGQGLKEAIGHFLEGVRQQNQAVTETKRAAIALGDFARSLIDSDYIGGDGLGSITGTNASAIARARASGLGPESYAPPSPDSQPYIARSSTSAGDDRDLIEEAADNSFRDIGEG